MITDWFGKNCLNGLKQIAFLLITLNLCLLLFDRYFNGRIISNAFIIIIFVISGRVSDHVEIRVNHVLTTKITYTNPSQEV